LAEIAENNIRIVADLAGYGDTQGLLNVPVKIYVDGTTEAGAVGEYKIYVNITRAEE